MPHAFSTTARLALAMTLALWAGGLRAEESSPGKGSKHPCDCEIWCGLFAALPDPDDGEIEDDRKLIVDQLAKAFPDHASFRLIGENTESVFKEYECWIVPSRQLFLKIDSLGEHPDKRGGMHVHLQLWQEDRVLLKSETILRKQPVFIAGPRWGDSGQLIMVLKMMKQADRASGK